MYLADFGGSQQQAGSASSAHGPGVCAVLPPVWAVNANVRETAGTAGGCRRARLRPRWSRWHVCRRCWWAWHSQRRRRSHRRCRWVTRRTTAGAEWVRFSRKRLLEEVVAEAEGSAAKRTAERATEERTADVLCLSWHDANDGKVVTATAARGAAPPRVNGLLTVFKDVAVMGDASWGRLSKWRPHWGQRRRRHRRLRLSVSWRWRWPRRRRWRCRLRRR